ncbi:MAG: hypothetical protein D6706_00025 [Chloroflexi bacterium]|nr:MAG: hypothetical protein D6706_00025 [Chloroflexota bacterium]
MTNLDEFGRNYLRLVLEINKHIEGYIDAWYGPDDLKAEVNATPKKEPAALLHDVAALQASIPTDDPNRHAWLVAVLRAIECTVRMLNGETFDYLDEVQRIYDIQPQKVDEKLFEEAHKILDTLLPGTDSLAERLEKRRKLYAVPAHKLMSMLDLARTETRRRTLELVDLPPGETVEVRLTRNQPWSAYNWYLGNGRSLIEFNTDIQPDARSLLALFAHEGYPGHHTEATLKEKLLYHEKGYAEQAAALLHSPSAVIAEGIATTAIEIIFPNSTHYHWTIEHILPQADLSPDANDSAETLQKLGEASRWLRYVSGNAAILYHTGQLNETETIEYIQTYALASVERARKSFSFITHPLFRSYIFTYTQGYELIQQAAQNGNKKPIFLRLLKEQILPSALANGRF